VSPIFVRPVREQLEHDRLIRFLLAKYKRKLEVAANVGDERVAPVKIGPGTFFPDLVLSAGKKLAGLVEVETGESVNNLEAMAQWVPFSRAKVPFHLYVPVPGFDAARRLCEANGAKPAEIWTYRATLDGFDLVKSFQDSSAPTGPKVAAKIPEPPPPAKAAVKSKPKEAAPVAKPQAAKPKSAKPKAKKPEPKKAAAKKPSPKASAKSSRKR
jgi:hypothetical protein